MDFFLRGFGGGPEIELLGVQPHSCRSRGPSGNVFLVKCISILGVAGFSLASYFRHCSVSH